MAETTIHHARTLEHVGDSKRQLSHCGMWLTHDHFSVNIGDITCSFCREGAIHDQKLEQRRQDQAANGR